MEDWHIVVRDPVRGPDTPTDAVDDQEPAATSSTTQQASATNNGPSAGATDVAAQPAKNSVVVFSKDVFTPPTVQPTSNRTFITGLIKDGPLSFGYTLDTNTYRPINVSLTIVDTDKNLGSTNYSVSATSASVTGLPLTFDGSAVVKFEYGKLSQVPVEGVSSASSDALGKVLSLKMYWEAKNGSTIIGHTYSPYFGILESNDGRVPTLQNDILAKENSAISSSSLEKVDSTQTSSQGGTSSSAPDGHSDSSSGSSGGGGLSTGAIVGIVIGAVAGLAIIGALIWFFLRRRKNNARGAGYTDARDSSNAYIADKDSTAQSPQSPYADDNVHTALPDTSSIHNNNTGSEHDHVPGPRDGSGTATPSGLSRNVAHLVEEGMTADDIARLEEEERQLDDEIERAGAGRR